MLIPTFLLLLTSVVLGADSSYLVSLAGKYPWEGADQNHPNFFEVPSVKAAFTQLVPSPIRHTILQELSMGSPNGLIEGFLVVSACEQHNCPGKNYIALANLKDNTVTFVLYDASAGSDELSSTQCFSLSRDLTALPLPLKEAVLEMHIPRMNRRDELYSRNTWVDDVKCIDGSNTSLERTRER